MTPLRSPSSYTSPCFPTSPQPIPQAVFVSSWLRWKGERIELRWSKECREGFSSPAVTQSKDFQRGTVHSVDLKLAFICPISRPFENVYLYLFTVFILFKRGGRINRGLSSVNWQMPGMDQIKARSQEPTQSRFTRGLLGTQILELSAESQTRSTGGGFDPEFVKRHAGFPVGIKTLFLSWLIWRWEMI